MHVVFALDLAHLAEVTAFVVHAVWEMDAQYRARRALRDVMMEILYGAFLSSVSGDSLEIIVRRIAAHLQVNYVPIRRKEKIASNSGFQFFRHHSRKIQAPSLTKTVNSHAQAIKTAPMWEWSLTSLKMFRVCNARSFGGFLSSWPRC